MLYASFCIIIGIIFNQKSPASKLNLKWYGKRNANLNEIGILLFVWNKCFVI